MALSRAWRKRVLIVLAVVVGVLIVALAVVYFRLNSIARVGIEKALSYVLQVDVTVASVELSPFSGRARVNGLKIPSPEGYKSGDAFAVERAEASVDLMSFRTDAPVIHEIAINAPRITLDQKATESNLSRLIKNASRFESGDAPKEEAPAESQKPIFIERLVIEKGAFSLTSPAVAQQQATLPLPRIELRNLGGPKERFVIAKTMKRTLTAILEESAKVVRDQLGAEASFLIGKSLEGVSATAGAAVEQLKETGQAVGDHVKEASGAVKEDVEKLGKGLKGLFGKGGEDNK